MARIVRLTALVFVSFLLVSRARVAGTPTPTDNRPKAACAFSNPGYSGWCRQTVPMAAGATPKQACEAVLSCLNNNACSANYCNAPNIRGGWKLEEAKASQPAPRN